MDSRCLHALHKLHSQGGPQNRENRVRGGRCRPRGGAARTRASGGAPPPSRLLHGTRDARDEEPRARGASKRGCLCAALERLYRAVGRVG